MGSKVADLEALASSMGVEVNELSKGFELVAPQGKVFAANGCHCYVDAGADWTPTVAVVRQLKKVLAMGLEDCEDPDCDWCADARGELEESADPWDLSEEDFKKSPPEGFEYSTAVSGEADAHAGRIRVGPKFFKLDRESRRHAVYHERGHALEDYVDWDELFALVDAGAFGPKDPETGLLVGFNGALTPGEALAEAYACLLDDRAWLEEKYPRAAEYVERLARLAEMPTEPLDEGIVRETAETMMASEELRANGYMPVWRGADAKGFLEIRSTEGGVWGSGVDFYTDPRPARSHASLGGGVISGWVPVDKVRISGLDKNIAHIDSAADFIPKGRVSVADTIDRDSYIAKAYAALEIPTGYVRDGDRWVFKGEAKEAAPAGLPEPSPEMVRAFDERTRKHVGLVEKWASKIEKAFPEEMRGLSARMPQHDASKFREPERTAYVYLTWKYANSDYEYPSGVGEFVKQAAIDHVHANPHHPESKGPRNMDALDLGEMMADWCAMSEELGNSPVDWATKNVGTKWDFSTEQRDLIFRVLRRVWEGKTESVNDALDRLSSPENIAASLAAAGRSHAEHLRRCRAVLNELPDGTTISGWEKFTIPGKYGGVFWSKGRRTVTDVVVEVGAKAATRATGVDMNNPPPVPAPGRPEVGAPATRVVDGRSERPFTVTWVSDDGKKCRVRADVPLSAAGSDEVLAFQEAAGSESFMLVLGQDGEWRRKSAKGGSGEAFRVGVAGPRTRN